MNNSGLRTLEIRSKMLKDRIRGKKIIILDIEETTFIPYILPIYRALRERSDKISYYIATYYQGSSLFSEFCIPAGRQFDVKLSKDLTQANIFLSPHIYGVGSDSSLKIHINHNQPVKYESYQKNDFIKFDMHFLTSPLHREQTENTIINYELGDRDIKLFDIGYSKSDKLLNGDYDREKILTDLKLDPGLKTVLYAPSWDEGLSLRTNGIEIIKNILKTENVNVIVKLHPISYCAKDGPNYLFYTGGTDWVEELSVFDKNKNFRHVPVNDIDPLLAASDVMVTDVSSVALEFIILDKPVIYIDCPEFFEKTLKKTYSAFGNTTAEFVKNDPKANAGRHTGKVVYDIDLLSEAINESLKNPKENSDKRQEFSKRLIYNPGRAAKSAAETILKLLGI